MPITLARQTYSPTVVFPIPSDCAIERSLIPSACLNRSTSRTLRIDNLSAGIRHPLRLLQGPDHAIRSPTDSPPSRHLSGGRLQLESCPPSVGMSGRFALECALTHGLKQSLCGFSISSNGFFELSNRPKAPWRARVSQHLPKCSS